MKKNTTIFMMAMFFIGFINTYAQSHYDKGWEYFNDNKLDEARDEFIDATKNSSTAKEAFLSLALLNTVDKEGMESFEAFKSFYALVDDPNPYLYTLWTDETIMKDRAKKNKDRLAFLKELLESGKLNSTMMAKANAMMGYHYQDLGDFKKSDEYFSKIGVIIDWQLAANFENISGSGFNKDFAPIKHPENDYEFTNRNGAPVKWFSILRYRPGRWIRPGYHAYTNNSIVYAQTFVKSLKDQEVQIRLGVSGSVKVWMNDKLMFSEEKERNNGIDSYIFTAKLKKGYNRILVQLGQSDDVSDMNFLMRITNNKGELMPDLTATNSPKDYTKETEFESKTLPHFCEAYFEQKLEQKPEDFLSLIMMANSYLKNDKSYQTRKILNRAAKLAPNSSFISNGLMDVYIREESQTLLSLELEKVKKNDPNNPLSLALLYNEAVDKEDWDEASGIIDKIEDIFGPNKDVYTKRIDILFKEEKVNDAVAKIREAYKKFPDSWSFVSWMYAVYVKVDKNLGAGLGVLKKYTKKNYNTSAYGSMAQHYKSLGNTRGAIDIYTKLLENMPNQPTYYAKIASEYAGMNNYSEAVEYYKDLVENAPYVGYYLGEIAKAYKEDDDDQAEEYFEKALILSPNDFDLRKIYRKYVGKKDIFDYFEEPDLYELYKNSETADDYPEDNSLVIYNESQEIYYERGGEEVQSYLLVKVFNSSGIDDWKEYNVGGYADIIKAEVLKKDGSQLKAETSGGHIVFTNLEEDDAILLIYRNKYANYGKRIKEINGREYFNFFYPYNHKKFSILVQGDRSFNYKAAHSNLKPTITDVDEFKLYVWERKDQESLKSEKYMQSIDDFSEVLHYSSVPDWNWVNKWYYDISTTKAKSDFEVQDVTKKLLEGKENLSDREKIHLIYDYVVQNIHYSSVSFRQSGLVPQKASKVINTKIGDCKDVSTLFVAMCREAGYKAEIVLVNTRDNGEQEMALPGIGFNHAIAKVYVDDTYYIVELTSDYNSFSTMGRNLKKAFVLEINNKDSKPYLLDAPTRLLNGYVRSNDVSFDDSKMIIVRAAINYGDYAAGTRGAYRDIGKKKQEKKMQRAISDDFAKVKLLELSFDTTLFTTDDSVHYVSKFEVSDAFTEFNNQYLLKIPFTYKQEPMDFLNNQERKYPLAFWEYINDDFQDETVTITFPKGMYLVSTPKNKIYTSKYVDYKLTFKKVGNKLIVHRRLDFKTDVVPTEDFEAFGAFYTKVIKADETQIGFKKR
jgi:tetratricopeptide (TPR) repeat protein